MERARFVLGGLVEDVGYGAVCHVSADGNAAWTSRLNARCATQRTVDRILLSFALCNVFHKFAYVFFPGSKIRVACLLAVGDTADWQSAPRFSGPYSYCPC